MSIFGLNIDMKTNLTIMNSVMNITFNLNNDTQKPYMEPNDALLYIKILQAILETSYTNYQEKLTKGCLEISETNKPSTNPKQIIRKSLKNSEFQITIIPT